MDGLMSTKLVTPAAGVSRTPAEAVNGKPAVQSYTVCNCSSSGQSQHSAIDSVTSHGGFIAMAAGLSIIVPLLSVFIIQLWRAKKEERARNLAEARRPAAPPADSVFDPPPSYEQVFNSNYVPTPGPLQSHEQQVMLVDERVNSRITNSTNENSTGEYHDSQIHIVSSNVDNSTISNDGRHLQESNSAPEYSAALGKSTPGSYTLEIPPGYPPDLSPYTNSSEIVTQSEPHISHGLNSDHVISLSNQISSISHHVSSSSSSPSTSTRQSHSGEADGNNSRSSENLTRLPGMHISVEDFLRSSIGVQNSENDPPPPSYDEALEILKSDAFIKDKLHI